jgi:hypothetical protein
MDYRAVRELWEWQVDGTSKDRFQTRALVLAVLNLPVLLLFIHSSINQWLYSPLLGSGIFFSLVIFFTQTVGLLGRVVSPSQGLYLNTGQHKHRYPSVRACEDSSCHGLCDRRSVTIRLVILCKYL